MDSVDCASLPNPNTTLAFLSPDMADQLEVSRYIYVASLGVGLCAIFKSPPVDLVL